MANEDNGSLSKAIDVGAPAAPTVDWNDTNMRSTYANLVNASSTREEVTLFVGTNQTWNPTATRRFRVNLTDRIVLNPHAAKRLWMLLGAILSEYESRFGKLDVEGIGQGTATAAQGQPQTAAKSRATKTKPSGS